MVIRYADPFEALFAFQRALENRLSSDWLGNTTAGTGSYPPVNLFQRGDDLVAIIELPGVNRNDLNIQVKNNSIRIAGRKSVDYPGAGERPPAGAPLGRVRPDHRHADADRS